MNVYIEQEKNAYYALGKKTIGTLIERKRHKANNTK